MLALLTPGSRSTATRIFAAQEAQSMPETVHSQDSPTTSAAISIPSGPMPQALASPSPPV
jgi:hypothetical protein